MHKQPQRTIRALICITAVGIFLSGCTTQQGYHGAGVGAVTGATAGILLDPHNRWRGALIGGGLGATLGGAMTDRPGYKQSYSNRGYAAPYRQGYRQQNQTVNGALIGGATGAAAGALLDHNNRWRGGLIGGALGGIFGGSIGNINSGPSIPALNP